MLRLVSVFHEDPCVGWSPLDRWTFNGFYKCSDEFTEEYCNTRSMKFKLIKKEVEHIGEAVVVQLTLKSVYSIEHPDSNQSLYHAEAVLVKE